MFATLVPFGDVADEPAQSLRATALLNGELAGRRISIETPGHEHQEQAGVDADPALVFAALTPHGGQVGVSAAAMSKAHQQQWTGTAPFMELTPLAVYAPVFYVPQAFGLALGRAIHLGPYHAAIFARLVNALAYLIIGVTALHVATFGRAIMFCVLIVPMSLNLAASLSQDGLIIATCVLAAACLSRTAGTSATIFRVAAAIAILCVAIVKPPYVCLVGLLLLPLPKSDAEWMKLLPRLYLAIAVAVPVILWFLLASKFISAPIYFAPRATGPLLANHGISTIDHTDPALQLRILLSAPWRLVTLPIHTFLANPLFAEMIGVLGWLDIILPRWFYNLWYFIALATIAATPLSKLPQHRQSRPMANFLLVFFSLFAAFLAIYISQYLVWTTPGATFIEGPQGRYMLPLIPFLAVAFQPAAFPYSREIGGFIALFGVVGGIIGLSVLPYLLTMAYYLH